MNDNTKPLDPKSFEITGDIIKWNGTVMKIQNISDLSLEGWFHARMVTYQVPFFTFVKVTVTVFLPSVRFRYFLTGYFSPAEVLYLFPSRIS